MRLGSSARLEVMLGDGSDSAGGFVGVFVAGVPGSRLPAGRSAAYLTRRPDHLADQPGHCHTPPPLEPLTDEQRLDLERALEIRRAQAMAVDLLTSTGRPTEGRQVPIRFGAGATPALSPWALTARS